MARRATGAFCLYSGASGKAARNSTELTPAFVPGLPPHGFSGHPTVVCLDEHRRCRCQGRSSNKPDLRREAEGRPKEIRVANGVGFPHGARWTPLSVFSAARSSTPCLATSAYLRRLRTRLASDRLARGPVDLTDLALDLGFCDHSHFTNAFRRELGVPPSRIGGAREFDAARLRAWVRPASKLPGFGS